MMIPHTPAKLLKVGRTAGRTPPRWASHSCFFLFFLFFDIPLDLNWNFSRRSRSGSRIGENHSSASIPAKP